MKVFNVMGMGTYIVWRRGDNEVAQAICHEKNQDGRPRFRKMTVTVSPVEGWTSTMVWKYQHGPMLAEELGPLLSRQPELKGWRIECLPGEHPMTMLLSKTKLAELCLWCDKANKQRPTDAQAYGEGSSETVDELMKWHGAVIQGSGSSRRQRPDRGF